MTSEAAAAQAPAVTSRPATGSARLRRGAIAAVVLLLALPSVVLLAGRVYQPASDWALMELRTRDVFTTNPPLIGAYSRYGWAHPGPLPYYLLAVPYQLLGGGAGALLWAALLLNVVMVAAVLWVAGRTSPAAMVGASALTAAVVRTATLPMVMHDPWNASLVVLPFLLLMVCCWCALGGDDRAALVGAFAYLFVVQAHVGFAVVATPLFAITAGWVWRGRRRRQARMSPRSRSAVAALAAVAALLVLPVLVDTLANWPGNAGRLVRWSLTEQPTPAAGWGASGRIMLRASSLSYITELRLPVFVNVLETPMGGGLLPGTCLVLLVAAGLWAYRSGHAGARNAATCLAVLWASVAISIANLRGPLLEWLFGWLAPVVWATWLTIACVGWLALRSLLQQASARLWADRVAAASAVVVVAACGVAQIGRVSDEPVEWQRVGAASVVLAAAAQDVADGAPIRLGYDGDTPDAVHLMAGVLNVLDRGGVRVQVPDDWALLAGGHRVAPLEGAVELRVSQQAVAAEHEGWQVISVYDEADPTTRAEVDALTRELSQVLVEIGRDDLVPALSTAGADIVLAAEPDPAL
ncbi:MAG: hypothetical protein Q7V88_14705, partial [Actinomycetota bacterium]|nr:hypothetical protein [Actinomycetota bacterium]